MDIVTKAKELAEQCESAESLTIDDLAGEGFFRVSYLEAAALAVETYRLLQQVNPPRAARFATRLRKRAEEKRLAPAGARL